MKVNWKKIFRHGYNAQSYHSAQYNGNNAKTDTRTSRSKLKRFLDKILT